MRCRRRSRWCWQCRSWRRNSRPCSSRPRARTGRRRPWEGRPRSAGTRQPSFAPRCAAPCAVPAAPSRPAHAAGSRARPWCGRPTGRRRARATGSRSRSARRFRGTRGDRPRGHTGRVRRRRRCSPRSPASAARPSGTSPVRRPLRDVGHGRIVRLRVLAWPRMRREIQPGYELDDDRERIDVAAVHRFLSEEAYWALGRPVDTVALLVRNSYRVLGLYHDGALVGYCRAVSDGAVHAYLADVYVLQEHRGLGLGEAMVREMVDSGELANARWMLHTGDMKPLWAFTVSEPLASRAANRPSGLALLPVLTTTIPCLNVRVMIAPLTRSLAVGLTS